LSPVKSFKVFGERVEILVTGEMTGGLSMTAIQTSPPGGGPPPHSHKNEDETFYVVEGEYELLRDGVWVKAGLGEAFHSKRGSIHTFRNAGTTTGKMLIFVAPAGLEKYLEKLSAFSVPDDMSEVLTLSEEYGITFVS
jgi:quercetin dioxygenase-like cupin family protein